MGRRMPQAGTAARERDLWGIERSFQTISRAMGTVLLQSFPGSGPLFPVSVHVFPRVSIAETWPFLGNSCGDIHGHQ